MKRGPFWGVIIFTSIIEILLLLVGRDYSEDLSAPRIIGILVTVAIYLWAIVLRLQDAGLSGWLVLLLFIVPVAVIVIGILPSKKKNAIYRNVESSENDQSKYNDQ